MGLLAKITLVGEISVHFIDRPFSEKINGLRFIKRREFDIDKTQRERKRVCFRALSTKDYFDINFWSTIWIDLSDK